MAQELIAARKLVLRYFVDAVWSRTVVDHFGLSPDVRVDWRYMITSHGRNALGSLLTAADSFAPPVSADLHVITRPEVRFRFAVTTLAHRLNHQLVELRFEGRQLDSILRSFWTSYA